MTDDDIHDHDVRDESMSATTRRGLLGALGVAGLASLGSGSASAQLGGGPEADAMSEYRVPYYRVPESDLDSPGVVGRRVEITSGGATYTAGDQLVDLGDRWELVSPNYGSVKTDDSVTVTTGEAGGTTLHYGSDQDRANAGAESVALGIGARANGDDGSGGSISQHVAVGYEAARNNTGGSVTAAGYEAARNNTGNRVTASGHRAALNNTGDNVTASGYEAARNNTGNRVTASGYKAARNNTGNKVTASGYQAAQNNTGDRITALGNRAARGDGLADPTTMGDDNIGIGDLAIRNNQASGLIAIGQEAGINAQTDDQLIITDRNGNRRMTMDLTNGDLNIDGSLTENASL